MGGRALTSKIARVGYYKPTLKGDCVEYVKKCDKCQRFTEVSNAPPEQLHSITSPWPFHKWGVNILGPFPPTLGQVKYLIVVMNYFTKWIEIELVVTIAAKRIKRFYWKKIICCFGLSGKIVLNNGTQFASQATANFCTQLGIKQRFTSVKHPQMNGQAEDANKVILRGLHRRLEEAKGRWAEELPQVLWSYHTTLHSSTNETPFRLTFGTEAVIPVEIGEPSPQTTLFRPAENEDEIRVNLDLLQEAREVAQIKEYAAKARATKRQRRKLVPKRFLPFDLVLRKVTRTTDNNKLTPIWEGPFRSKRSLPDTKKTGEDSRRGPLQAPKDLRGWLKRSLLSTKRSERMVEEVPSRHQKT
ncbi:Tf2-9, partial [Mucuna pruriens]